MSPCPRHACAAGRSGGRGHWWAPSCKSPAPSQASGRKAYLSARNNSRSERLSCDVANRACYSCWVSKPSGRHSLKILCASLHLRSSSSRLSRDVANWTGHPCCKASRVDSSGLGAQAVQHVDLLSLRWSSSNVSDVVRHAGHQRRKYFSCPSCVNRRSPSLGRRSWNPAAHRPRRASDVASPLGG